MSAAPEDVVWPLDDLMALPDDGRRHELLWGAFVTSGTPWCWLLRPDLSLEVRRLAGSSYEMAQVVRTRRAVEVLGPLQLSLDPGTLGAD